MESREKLDKLSSINKVSLIWVPGHVGIAGIGVADQQAKRGASAPFTGPESVLGVGETLTRNRIKAEESSLKLQYFQSIPGCRQAKKMLGNYNNKRTQQLLNMNRSQMRILTGFLTGHCKLNAHLTKMGVVDGPTCRFCHIDNEDPMHLLIDCDAVARRRSVTLGILQPREEDLPLMNPSSIIRFLREIGLEGAL